MSNEDGGLIACGFLLTLLMGMVLGSFLENRGWEMMLLDNPQRVEAIIVRVKAQRAEVKVPR